MWWKGKDAGGGDSYCRLSLIAQVLIMIHTVPSNVATELVNMIQYRILLAVPLK